VTAVSGARIWLLALLLLLSARAAHADLARRGVEAATMLLSGDLAGAIAAYEQLTDKRGPRAICTTTWASPTSARQPGSPIWSFERALEVDADDEDGAL